MSDQETLGSALWRAILSGRVDRPRDDLEAITHWARRLAEVTSPALAAHLLAPVEAALGRSVIDPEAARESRLLSRLVRSHQSRCLAAIAEAGIAVVVLKGFANAHLYYDNPDARVFGDLDILVRPDDRRRLIDLLERKGYRFRPAPQRAWGSIATASAPPMMSPDGLVNLDIHGQPDSYPLDRGLRAEMVFERSTACAEPSGAVDGTAASGLSEWRSRVRAPCPEHTLLLLVSNAARDKFGPFAVTKLLDAAAMLRGDGPDIAWSEVSDLAEAARLMKPLCAFVALLHRLGMPTGRLPSDRVPPLSGIAAAELERAVTEWQMLFPGHLSAGALLRREWALCASPSVAFHRTLLRLGGIGTRLRILAL